MTKKCLIRWAVLGAVTLATLSVPSKAEAYGPYYRPYTRTCVPVAYPAYRSYYYPAPVMYSRPVYYTAPVLYSTPVVYSPAPVVYSRPVYYGSPYYYGSSGFSFGYYGNSNNHYGGVSFRVGY